VQSKLPQSVLSKSLIGSAAVLGDDNDSLGYVRGPLSFIHRFTAFVILEFMRWYGDGAGNTVEENSSVFSLIHVC